MERTTSFGYWLRRRRKALDLTQEELAKQVGCAVGTLKKLESDDRRPSREMAERLADLLQIASEERVAFLKAARAELAADRLDLVTVPLETPALVTLASLPTGTLTFLFSDIQDSTRLWVAHPAGMRLALARHDALLREAIERHGGTVFKTVGDAFHAAFGTATDALAATLDAQRALQRERWEQFLGPDAAQSPIRVRMALHTGAAEVRDGDYFGHTLNRVARILVAGHGGQVLLSAASWELLRDHLPTDTTLRDLGAYWLKGLPRPERIYQLEAVNLLADFPPLVSLDRPTTNVPAQTTAFIGREREVGMVCDLLRRTDVRLVTLTGPGGGGKTRLSIQVATELLVSDSRALLPQRESETADAGLFPNGVWFVNLAPISNPDLVALAIAQALDVRDTGGQPIRDQLKDELREKRMLLLLDNFEQIVDAASLVGELLAAAPGLRVLVTSRMPLRLSGERDFAVPPLALPDPKHLPTELDRLTQYEAVRLFIERAQAVKPDFAVTNENAPAVAEICYRLDGLPLAIELAAAWVKLFPARALLTRLGSRLKLLTGGARDLPERQQTIRNTIDWSYNLLDEGEKRLFTRLGVFVGGCTLDAVEAVCNADPDHPIDVVDGIAALLDQSLVRRIDDLAGEPRFTMLETIREYALEQLTARGESKATRQRDAAHFLRLAEAAEPWIRHWRPERELWLERLAAEHENLRAALGWFSQCKDAESLAQLAWALRNFWIGHFHWGEGRAWLQVALAQSNELSEPTRAKVLVAVGAMLTYLGDSMGRAYMEEGLVQLRQLGDKANVAITLWGLGFITLDAGEYVLARAFTEESLALYNELGDVWGRIDIFSFLVNVATAQNDLEQAARYNQEVLSFYRQSGTKQGLGRCLNDEGVIAQLQNRWEHAAACYAESLTIFRETGVKNLATIALVNLGTVALHQDDVLLATACFEEGMSISRAIEHRYCIALNLAGFAGIAAAQGQAERSARLFGAAYAQFDSIGKVVERVDRIEHDRHAAVARAQLGNAGFEAALAAGSALSLEEAITLALEPPIVAVSEAAPEAAVEQPRTTPLALAQPTTPTPAGLTARELAVLRLVAQGLSYAQIAEQLVISPRTVNRHLSAIYSKLDVTSRHAATRFAIDNQLV
jgi:predicted ATPase/class 3 adenylate cyclase/DNA-binding CsgD family transcriptional regulator